MSAWITTDHDGRIEMVSREARQLFGAHLPRGSEIVETLSLPRRAALFDIEVALTGWPAERNVVLDRLGGQLLGLRYRISRQLATYAGLFWQFELQPYCAPRSPY